MGWIGLDWIGLDWIGLVRDNTYSVKSTTPDKDLGSASSQTRGNDIANMGKLWAVCQLNTLFQNPSIFPF